MDIADASVLARMVFVWFGFGFASSTARCVTSDVRGCFERHFLKTIYIGGINFASFVWVNSIHGFGT